MKELIRKFFLFVSIIFFGLSAFSAAAQTSGDLALNKPIISVSSTATGSSPTNAVDGNPATFWTSGSGGAQWLGIDLGQTTSIGTVVVKWGSNSATNYDIELSDDGIGFTVVRSGLNGDFNASLLGSGRYILIRTTAGSGSNYQLASLEVYTAPIVTSTPIPTPTSTTASTTVAVNLPVGVGDGYVRGGGTSWNTFHAATDGDAAYTSSTGTFIRASSFDTMIYRAFLPIDTSSIPDNATITSATLNLHFYNIYNGVNDGNDFVSLVQTSQALTSTVTAADFDAAGAIPNPVEGSNRLDISNITLNQFTAIPLNATGLSWINKTGTTMLGMREGHDILNIPIPAGLGNDIRAYSSEQTGATQDPYLTITYTVPAGSTPAPTSTPIPTPTPTPIPTSTPSGATITLNPATTYQTFTGWEGTDYIGDEIDPGVQIYKDALLTQLVNDMGINRIRMEIRSGSENSQDYWTQFIAGQIDYATWKAVRYQIVNDNSDPNNINQNGYKFAQQDWKMDNIVMPLKQKLEARGEKLFINMNYVGFSGGDTIHITNPQEYAEFMLATFQHMQTKYGIVPDSIEIALEPDNTTFNGTRMGQALQATATKLSANGFNPKYVLPSTTLAANALNYFNAVRTVLVNSLGSATAADTFIRNNIQEISYHRYGGVTPLANIQAIGNASVSYGIGASMLECWTGAGCTNGYNILHEDLKAGRNTAWQQKTFKGIYDIDTTNPTNPIVTISNESKFIRQYTKFIRNGAQRIDATTQNSTFDPVAFINKNGRYVVVVKATAGGNFSVGNLPSGTYGINYTVSSTQYNIDLSDQTITSGQSLSANIPAAGAITIYAKTATGPTSVPTAVPTATPTPIPCTLTSASWSTATTTEGSNVNLNVVGNTQCAGKTVNFEVRRNGTLIDDIPANIQPQSASMSATFQASTIWTAERNPLIPFTDAQYYFKVTPQGGVTIDTKPQLLTVTSGATQTGPQIASITDNRNAYTNSQVPKFEKLEITFQVNNTVASNLQMPFDPAPPPGIATASGITVNGEFSQDNFQTIYTQPAFYYQDFDYSVKNSKDWIYPNGNYAWKVRFAPNKEGNWQYRLTATDASGSSVSPIQNFAVAANPNNHGFIKVSKTDSRYFEYEDGTYFPGLGYNMNFDQISWNNPVLENQSNFQKMDQNGIKLIRLWLPQWGIFGATNNPWHSLKQGANYTALNALGVTDSRLSGYLPYPGSDVGMIVETNWNPTMFLGWFQEAASVKPNTKYHISIRYLIPQDFTPIDSTKPYGLVLKKHTIWLDDPTIPGTGTIISSYANSSSKDGSGKAQWSTFEGSFTTGSTDNFIPFLYLTLENTLSNYPTTGKFSYIDRVDIQEDLGNSQYGVNIMDSSWMAHHQYMNQQLSFAFDKVLDLAHQNDIYLKLVGLEHNDDLLNAFNSGGNYVGNFKCDTAIYHDLACFYGNGTTSTKIGWLQQSWWRYMQARWGYSTNVHSWEMTNEGDPDGTKYAGATFTLPENFGKYMHQWGNYHLTTTSFWSGFPKNFWGNTSYPNMDYADIHQYIRKDTDPTGFYDPALATQSISNQYGAKLPGGVNKPVVRGETGLTDTGTQPGTTLLNGGTQSVWLHKLIWGGINSGGLLDSGYWYPDSHIYNKKYTGSTFDFRNEFGKYYNFIKDIPLSNGNYKDAAATSSNTNLRVWGQKDIVNGKAHLWIDNKTHNWNNVVKEATGSAGLVIPQSGTITISGMSQSNYTVSWFDTYAGNVVKVENLIVGADGVATLNISSLASDVAVKLEKTAAAPCDLTAASWSAITATQGSSVNLNVTGNTQCAGKIVNFEVRRNGTLLDDIAANIQPQSASMSATFQASTTWTAEFNPLIPGTNPQYYFKVTVVGGNTIDTKTQLLTVSGSQTPTPTPTLIPTPTTSPKPMPLISRNLPVSASSGRASDGNDAWYTSSWTATPSAWLAYDISSVAVSKKGKILLTWFNDPTTYNYDDTVAATGYNGVPASYTIEANNAVGGGSAPVTGWIALTSVTNNLYHSRQHLLDLTGYNWLRINISGVRDSYGGTQVKINTDLHDASLGTEDDWILYGDSFVAFGLHHGMMGTTGNLSQLINGANNAYYPLFEAAGSNGASSTHAVAKINTWLSIFPGKYVILAFGSNDALNSTTPSTYYSNMSTLVQAVIAAGKVPIVPKIPWGNNATLLTRVPLLNAEIDKLYTSFPQIIHGPDLWTYFQNNPTLIDSGGIHPTNPDGYAALRQQWVNTMLSNVYQIAVSTPSATPVATLTPTTVPTPCSISNVSWPTGTTSISEGSSANISVSVTGGCSGKQVHLTVRKNITLQPDVDAINQPNPRDVALTLGAGNISSGSATWTADAWSNACLVGNCNPTYFAKANIVGETTEATTDRNNDLTVIQSVIVPTAPNDWPQVQKDAQHTGYSAETLGTNFKVKFTYPFQPDRIFPQTQTIVYQGKVFIGTEGANGQKPTLYALDAVNPETGSNPPKGKVLWRFEADGPILNSVAAYNNKIYFGTFNGSVYAVNTDGTQAWKKQLSQDLGFVTAPVIADNKIMLGGRDGKFYALNLDTGATVWSYDAGAPILQTAAFDNNKVYFGAMDMYVYALNTADGSLAWKSSKIPGMAFKDYWPVVYQNKVIIAPMVNKVSAGVVPGFPFNWYGAATDWNWLAQWGSTVATGGATLVPDIVNAQNTAINAYNSNPGNYTQNLYILDANNGNQAMVVPNWNTQAINGAHTPPCVDRDGKLIVPTVFIRSGWGRLDLSIGRITDVLYDGYDYQGRRFPDASCPLTGISGLCQPAGSGNKDENLNVSCTANMVLGMHTQEANANYTGAFNLDTRRWTMLLVGAKNLQMSDNNQSGGGNPATISNGLIYHTVWHELIVRTTN